MKDYKTPELELVKYDVEECLDASVPTPTSGISTETEDIGPIIGGLV